MVGARAGASLALAATMLVGLAACSSDTPVELNQQTPSRGSTLVGTARPTSTSPTSTSPTSAGPSSPGTGPNLTSTTTAAPTLPSYPSTTPAGPGPGTTSSTASGTASGAPSPTLPGGQPGGNMSSSPVRPGQPAPGTPFDQARAVSDYTALISQIAAIDGQPLTGAAVSQQLTALAARFQALQTAPVPPTVDGPTYLGRLYSLQLFAAAAAGEAQSGSPQAASRYAVIRQETGTFLSLVNAALGTSLTLPAPGPAAGSRPLPSTTSLPSR